MSRLITAALVAIAMVIAVPAAATVNETNAASPDVHVELNIGCFTNVYWNNTNDDHEIFFNDIVQDGSNLGDWWRADLTGAYGAANPGDPKASQDAWATGYFESYDEAFFWFQANCDVQMTVTTGGNLTHTSTSEELDTWFTMSLTNGTGTADGFINGGARMSDGSIPLDGLGTYADDSNTDTVMELFGGAFYPGQYSFPMGSGAKVYTANFDAFAEGTILFHARVLRNGISDTAGKYTSSLNMTFAETTP